MRYLGTGFSLTIGGLRLRIRVDLDEVDDGEERRPAAGTPSDHDHGTEHRFPHHVRSRRA
jgi:hypothetical protein